MTNKEYYTPSIEEFHIGFEYELKSAGEEGPKEWRFRTIERADFIGLIESYSRRPDFSEKVRVKYLDSGDLESLGYTRTTKGEDVIWRNPNNISVIIEAGYKNGYIIHNGSSTFSGVIRNKSELKQVLRMLRVQGIEV